MDSEDHRKRSKDDVDITADSWVIRRDRGLSREEQQKFDELCAQDEKLSFEVEESEKAWSVVKQFATELPEDLLNEIIEPRVWYRPLWRIVGIAATLMLGTALLLFITFDESGEKQPAPYAHTFPTPTTERLPDGSIVRINTGSELEYEFNENVREVHLAKGEAHFTVTKNPERPFIVFIGKVRVRAVGTAFNVKLIQNRIDVFVTEGTVEIESEEPSTNLNAAFEAERAESGIESKGQVSFGQRAEIRYSSEGEDYVVTVNQTNETELKHTLGWRESLLSFSGATLEVIANNFESKTGIRMIIKDRELNRLKVGGNFPSDDPYGFLNILRDNYGVDWDQVEDDTVVLRRVL